MNVPAKTADIFDRLSKGQFVSANSRDKEQEKLYNVIDAHFDTLKDYFGAIHFQLERGDEYFYFSRTDSRSSLEDKIERAYRYIDWLDFFKTFDPVFGAGFRFSPDQIAHRCKVDSELRTKLDALVLKGGADNHLDKIRQLIRTLERESFFELENELQETYLVLNAFDYLEQLIDRIDIAEV
ncbi:MAG: hypothetical protein OHK0039_24590 [Bacteroidia bacterium]